MDEHGTSLILHDIRCYYCLHGFRKSNTGSIYIRYITERGPQKTSRINLIPEFGDDSPESVVNGFVADVLMERGLPGEIFHRFSNERQLAILKEHGVSNLEDLFNTDKLSAALIPFYKNKIVKGPTSSFDPLTDS